MRVNIFLILSVLLICLGCNDTEETHEIGESCKNIESEKAYCNSAHTSLVACDKVAKKYVEKEKCEKECFDDWGSRMCITF